MSAHSENLEVGIVERYFLRRLALARKKKYVSAGAPYHDAMVELILIVLIMPAIAVFSFIVSLDIAWWKDIVDASESGISFRKVAFALAVMVFVVGQWQLGRRFKKYKLDVQVSSGFDTERDHRIVFWQRLVVFFICGVVVPFVGMAAGGMFE